MPAPLESFFLPGGPLARSIQAFEPRPEQREMALAVHEAVTRGKHLIVEAGTGVGKSLAYLLPCALWAAGQGKKVVVATYTKALQEQLIGKDLPLVQAILQKTGLSFRFAHLMGAENYLCRQRLERCLGRERDLFAPAGEAEVLAELHRWGGEASTGLRGRIPFDVPQALWEQVCRDSDLCLGRRGPHWETCLYRKDVARARLADLLVVNQHLFFAGMPTPPFDAVVMDEAHNLEKVASQFMGLSVTDRKLKRLSDDLLNPRSGRGLARRLRGTDRRWKEEVAGRVGEAGGAAAAFFETLRARLGLDAPQGAPQESSRRVREPFVVADTLSPHLQGLVQLLDSALPFSRSAEEEAEIGALQKRFAEASRDLAAFLKCESREHAYWIEVSPSPRAPVTSLNVAPLDVSGALRKELFEKHKTVILTSATLAVEGSFATVKSRLGAAGSSAGANISEILERRLDSPYDYPSRAALFIDPAVPDPTREPEGYEELILRRVPEIARFVPGGIFALFTNRKFLERAHARWVDAGLGRPIFKQGERAPQELLEGFRRSGNGLLLGTETFWQGVDVPGPALVCVILTRLPFASPSSPLEEARTEWMAARGLNVFNEYALPAAVIRFRQGFGRLIRSHADFGAVVILDPRIRARPYGRAFLRSLPVCKQVASLVELEEFFRGIREAARVGADGAGRGHDRRGEAALTPRL